MSKPKILIYDIETAPILAWVWSNWQTNVIETKEDWYVLSVQHAWYDPDVLPEDMDIHFERKAQAKGNDRALLQHAWNLIDEADVIVAHNGDSFDIKKLNTRFLKHGLGLPSPAIQIDTKKEAKRHLNLASYSLAQIGRYYGLGHKTPHTGFALWLGCMDNDPDSWALMEEYGNQDVRLLAAVYRMLFPVMNYPGRAGNRFNMQQWTGANTCTTCGSSRVEKRGKYRTKAGWKRTIRCLESNCKSWSYYRMSNTEDSDGSYR